MARPKTDNSQFRGIVADSLTEVYWPRFKPTVLERKKDAVLIASAALMSVVMTACIGGTQLFLLVPLITVPVVGYFVKRLDSVDPDDGAQTSNSHSSDQIAIAYCLAATIVPTISYAVYPRLYPVALTLVLVGFVIRFTNLVIRYFVRYHSAHHGLDPEAQRKWRTAFSNSLWKPFPFVEPANINLTQQEKRIFRRAIAAFQNYRRRVAIFICLGGGLASIAGVQASSGTTQEIICLGLIVVLAGLSYVQKWTDNGTPSRTWQALEIFINSPRDTEKGNWSTLNRRKGFLHCLILGVTLVLCFASSSGHSVDDRAGRASLTECWMCSERFASLCAAILRGDSLSSVVLVASIVVSSMLVLGLLFLTIHALAGPTIHHAERILQDET